ncbi:MAG TPA: chromosome partitioning protein ParA [Microvirga sp.]|jgi:crescentin|nr:chromosome partitioning protein ParA [Microvirga sp.]
MSKSWATLRKRFGKGAEGEADDEVTMPKATPLPPLVPAVHEAPEPIVRPNGSLDTVGQKNELIRVRFANLVDRLDEIRSLRDDFTALSEPVFDLISSYPQVQSRLLETEAVLRQEHETMSAQRRELSDLTVLQAKTADELTAAVAQLRKAEAKVREQDSILEDLRLNLKDREAMASDLENQLAIETERARSVTEENHALRLEAQEADQAVARAERELIETRERTGLLDHEAKRLQKVAEEQNYRLTGYMKRQSELESQFEAARQRVAELESKLMAEQAARQRIETQIESERSSHQADLSSLDMKTEGLTSRLVATDKILAHTRDQLRDKNEALRSIERVLKETAIEKNTLDRRLLAAQQETERQTSLVAEMQRSRMELQERVEMLNKAFAAKDFQVEGAENKVAALSERIDQMTKRFEQERNTLEALNRRLTEELQNEKAERSMLQGALEIARESRAKIQNKYVSLRKKTRLDTAEDEGAPAIEDEVVESNVRPIKPAAEPAE